MTALAGTLLDALERRVAGAARLFDLVMAVASAPGQEDAAGLAQQRGYEATCQA
jgi:hypothetical protein